MSKNKYKTGKKERITVLIDRDILKEIDKLSLSQDRTRSATIRVMLENQIKKSA